MNNSSKPNWISRLCLDVQNGSFSGNLTEEHFNDVLKWLLGREFVVGNFISECMLKTHENEEKARQNTFLALDDYLFVFSGDSPFARLGLRSNADLAMVKIRYRRLIQLYHPDKGLAEANGLSHRAEKINRAYDRIKAGDFTPAPAAHPGYRNTPRANINDAPFSANTRYRAQLSDKLRLALGSSEKLAFTIISILVLAAVALVFSVYNRNRPIDYPAYEGDIFEEAHKPDLKLPVVDEHKPIEDIIVNEPIAPQEMAPATSTAPKTVETPTVALVPQQVDHTKRITATKKPVAKTLPAPQATHSTQTTAANASRPVTADKESLKPRLSPEPIPTPVPAPKLTAEEPKSIDKAAPKLAVDANNKPYAPAPKPDPEPTPRITADAKNRPKTSVPTQSVETPVAKLELKASASRPVTADKESLKPRVSPEPILTPAPKPDPEQASRLTTDVKKAPNIPAPARPVEAPVAKLELKMREVTKIANMDTAVPAMTIKAQVASPRYINEVTPVDRKQSVDMLEKYIAAMTKGA